MNVSERLAASAVVPVVVLDDAKDAVATAKALLAGGVDVMEITFRTAAAADSIKAVAESCPDMLVGAGTVITLEQCKKAVECGAKFIVAPGFDEEGRPLVRGKRRCRDARLCDPDGNYGRDEARPQGREVLPRPASMAVCPR